MMSSETISHPRKEQKTTRSSGPNKRVNSLHVLLKFPPFSSNTLQLNRDTFLSVVICVKRVSSTADITFVL